MRITPRIKLSRGIGPTSKNVWRNFLCLTIQEHSGSHTPTTRHIHCWDWSPFAAGGSSDLTGALLDSLPTHPTLKQSDKISWPAWLLAPIIESQTSHFLKYFIHGAVAQKQLELMPLRSGLKQRNPWDCIPSCNVCSLSTLKSTCIKCIPQQIL